MTDVFVVRNQLGHYWGKSKEWVDGREPKRVLCAKYEDEAINTLFELGSKDFELRGEVVSTELDDRGEPVIEPSEHLIEPAVEETGEIESEASVEADARDAGVPAT
jgi:hypothetical protein